LLPATEHDRWGRIDPVRSDPQVCGVEGRREDAILGCMRKREEAERGWEMR